MDSFARHPAREMTSGMPLVLEPSTTWVMPSSAILPSMNTASMSEALMLEPGWAISVTSATGLMSS